MVPPYDVTGRSAWGSPGGRPPAYSSRQVEGDVERLKANGALAAQVAGFPAVFLASEVLDARLGARDHEDVLE